MTSPTPVDRLYGEASAIIRALPEDQPSLAIAAGDSLRKGLLLAVASHFEYHMTSTVMLFVGERAPGDTHVVELVRNKAVDRQYHTWFDWESSNANRFFALFGQDFKTSMQSKVDGDEALRTSIKAFLVLGFERNRLVHEDFASFPLEKTLEEIYSLYRQALPFVESVPNHLRAPLQ